jgi:hypothetical protein
VGVRDGFDECEAQAGAATLCPGGAAEAFKRAWEVFTREAMAVVDDVELNPPAPGVGDDLDRLGAVAIRGCR